jgi:hypothetical protein
MLFCFGCILYKLVFYECSEQQGNTQTICLICHFISDNRITGKRMPLPEAEGINLTLHPKSATAVWVSQLLAGIQFPNFVKKIIPRTIKQASMQSYDSAPRPPSSPPPSFWTGVSVTQEVWERETICWREKGEGVGRSRIIRPQVSLVFYKSFNTLWY